MSETNQRTVESYEAHVQAYVEGTPQVVDGAVKDWIDASLEGLPQDARIIEFGSAFGRDADYIESRGYPVERTDVTQGFVDLLRSKGHTARQHNAITDDLAGPYDLVFADAVLLHFTRDETKQVVEKVFNALSPNGRLSISLKQGEGEEWSEAKLDAPRFFCYWQRDSIAELLHGSGFGDVSIGDDSTGHNNAKWLHIIAKK